MASVNWKDSMKKPVKRIKGNKDEVKMDIIANVPIEIAQYILNYLPPNDVVNAWRCDRRWKDIMNDNYFWEMKCIADKYYELKEENKSKVYNSFIEKFTYWQGVYMYNQRLEHNWRANFYRKVKIPHVNHYHRLHHFDDNMLLASTTRNLIRVIDSSTGKIHSWYTCWAEGRIVKVLKRGNFLLACSTNNCLRVWDTESKMCVLDMELITRVLASDIYQNLLVLGYDNGKFSVFNVESGLVVFEDNGNPVRCISFYKDFIFTGSLNGTIQGIQIGTECKKVYSFECCRNIPIHKMMITNKGYMINFNEEGTLCVYKLFNLEKLHTIYAHFGIPFFLTYEDQFFCIAQDQITIEVWNFVTGKRLLTIDNVVPITFIRTNGTHVLICSEFNNSIKMWCLNTGRFISKIKMKLRLREIRGIFFTKTKLVYFGWSVVKKTSVGVMCIHNYEF